MALKLAAAFAFAAVAQGTLGQDDVVSMVQRAAEPPTPRPRGKKIHLPSQDQVTDLMRDTVQGVSGEANRVFNRFVETDREHYEYLRRTEAEDKARHHAKEALREQEQEEKREKIHAKKVDAYTEESTRVETEKKSRADEQVKRQEAYKAEAHQHEQDMVKADHDQKESDYESRDSVRAEKTAIRDAILKERRYTKAREAERLASKKEAEDQYEADVMSGNIKLPENVKF
mmetsp:Transcript_66121/g.176116  ORF Transcript_66121/g.176116 Transcript_66121/m.176116 type:complete len:230 (-) Transcript_66121:49-738(-)